MADYIDQEEYDKVMFDCKMQDKLSLRAIEMFELHAREVSKKYNQSFKTEEDRKDVLQFAMNDFVSYWKGYGINPVCGVFFVRDFLDGEMIVVKIKGGECTYTAKKIPTSENDFKIRESINKTLGGLGELITKHGDETMVAYVYKVKQKLTIIDKTVFSNSDGVVFINKIVGNQISKNDKSVSSGDTIFHFENPPPAFNYFTSMARNGILKGLKQVYPKAQKLMINFSDINKANGGLFNG